MTLPLMGQNDSPLPGPSYRTDDDINGPNQAAAINSALKRLARLIGRQIAREAFEARQERKDKGFL